MRKSLSQFVINLYIFCYNICVLCSLKKILTFSKKKCFFLRKYVFSRKLEGGTGLQGVSSNLNITAREETIDELTLLATKCILH